MRGAVVFQPAVEFGDFLGRMLEKVVTGKRRRLMRRRKERGQDRAHGIRPRDLNHRRDVRLDVFRQHRTAIAADVIRSRKDNDGARPQRDDVLPEAKKHLRRRLRADPAIDGGLAGEMLFEIPAFGDGISEKDDAVFARARRLERGVGGAVARQGAVIVHDRLQPRLAPCLKLLLEGRCKLAGHGALAAMPSWPAHGTVTTMAVFRCGMDVSAGAVVLPCFIPLSAAKRKVSGKALVNSARIDQRSAPPHPTLPSGRAA